MDVLFTNVNSPLHVPDKKVEFNVVKELNDSQCVIIGINLLTELKCYLNSENNTLELENGIIALDEPKYSKFEGTIQQLNNVNSILTIKEKENELKVDLTNYNILGLSLAEIKMLQNDDKIFKPLFNFIGDFKNKKCQLDDLPQECIAYKNYVRNIEINESDILVYNNSSILVSKNRAIQLVLDCHEQFSHCGSIKLRYELTSQIFHPDLQKIINDVSFNCLTCQLIKDSPLRWIPPTLKIQTRGPGHIVAVDLVALPKTSRGKIGCLVSIDIFSKRSLAVPISSKTGSHIANIFKNNILNSLIALPVNCLSDNGGEFRSFEFNNVLNEFGIDHIYVTPHRPESNGCCERYNRTLFNILRGLEAKGDSWDLELPKAISIYNNSYHKEIKDTPNNFLLKNCHDKVKNKGIKVDITHTWRKGHPKFSPFRKGQLVLWKTKFQGNLTTNKLKDRFVGPFCIRDINQNQLTYIIERRNENNQLESHRAHYIDLRIWKEPPKYLCRHPRFQDLNGKLLEELKASVILNNESNFDNYDIEFNEDLNLNKGYLNENSNAVPVIEPLPQSENKMLDFKNKKGYFVMNFNPNIQQTSLPQCLNKTYDIINNSNGSISLLSNIVNNSPVNINSTNFVNDSLDTSPHTNQRSNVSVDLSLNNTYTLPTGGISEAGPISSGIALSNFSNSNEVYSNLVSNVSENLTGSIASPESGNLSTKGLSLSPMAFLDTYRIAGWDDIYSNNSSNFSDKTFVIANNNSANFNERNSSYLIDNVNNIASTGQRQLLFDPLQFWSFCNSENSSTPIRDPNSNPLISDSVVENKD